MGVRVGSALVALVVAGMAGACKSGEKQRPSGPGGNAQALEQTAATPEQKRLWKEAAERGAAGLDKVPVADKPVAQRGRVPVADAPAPRPPAGLPKELPSGIRIADEKAPPRASFTGTAKVIEVKGEALTLQFGDKEQMTLSLHVRARGAALAVQPGEPVQIEYRSDDEPRARMQVVALRSRGGDGLVSVLETGSKPVTARVPLYQLVATQSGEVERGAMPVEVQVGGSRKSMRQGETADFAKERLTVTLIASSAAVGAAAFQEEGPPYAIRLLAVPMAAAAAPK